MTMQVDTIEQQIRQDVITRRFPAMADASVTHQSYESAQGTRAGVRGRMKGLADERPTPSGRARHQFIYHKQFGAGDAAIQRTVIVITDDDGAVQRVFRSR
jgi:hypothetical protein